MLEKAERALILSALRETGWNRTAAAKLLRINRTTLREKIKRLGLRFLTKEADLGVSEKDGRIEIRDDNSSSPISLVHSSLLDVAQGKHDKTAIAALFLKHAV